MIEKFIVTKLLNYCVKQAGKYLNRSERALTLLKKLGLSIKLENDFASIYTHTLINYAVDKELVDLIRLFGEEEVQIMIERHYLAKDRSDLYKVVYGLVRGNQKLQGLGAHFSPLEEMQVEIDLFLDGFHQMAKKAMDPVIRLMFNEMQEIRLDLLRKSFSYQVDQYLNRKKDEFEHAFLDLGKYVPLVGEQPSGYTKNLKISQKGEPHFEIDSGIRSTKKPIDWKEEAGETQLKFDPIDTFFSSWLEKENTNLLILIGQYGTGKTTFSRYLLHQLASDRLNESDQDKQIIRNRLVQP